MYGQTEATARMAYLPPDLARAPAGRSACRSRAGRSGSSRVADRPGPDVGELVYAGPNVMLGYAESPADLASAAPSTSCAPATSPGAPTDGLYEIVGRRSRFAKSSACGSTCSGSRRCWPRTASTRCLRRRRRRAGRRGRPASGRTAAQRPAAGRRATLRPAGPGGPGARAARAAPAGHGQARLRRGRARWPRAAATRREPAARRPAPAADLVPALRRGARPRRRHRGQHASSAWAATRCPTSRCRCGWSRLLGHLPADWHTTPIRDARPPPAARRGAAGAARWRPAWRCARSRSC